MKATKVIRGAFALAAMLLGASAHAQLFRAYLASTGSDANPCTVAAPCRLLPAALNAVADGGEVWMLDSANFNTAKVSVTKSVTILAIPGAVGSLVATLEQPAIEINTAGTKVALRNLVFTKLLTAPGSHGVQLISGDELIVENCTFSRLTTGDGINVGGAAKVRVSGSLFSGNNVGIRAYANATVNVSNTRLYDNGFAGILADGAAVGTAVVNVADVTVTGSQFGVIAWSKLDGSNVQIFVRRATVSAALEGVVSYIDVGITTGTALVAMGGSMVTANDTGLVQSGTNAVFKLFGDNQVTDNLTADSAGTYTTVARQ
jgi:hypothetical protein